MSNYYTKHTTEELNDTFLNGIPPIEPGGTPMMGLNWATPTVCSVVAQCVMLNSEPREVITEQEALTIYESVHSINPTLSVLCRARDSVIAGTLSYASFHEMVRDSGYKHYDVIEYGLNNEHIDK
jgi:hypothetical protein